MIFLRPTDGAKLVLKKWIEELQLQPWSKMVKSNDQPAFNWALMKIAKEVYCIFLHPSCIYSSYRPIIQIYDRNLFD